MPGRVRDRPALDSLSKRGDYRPGGDAMTESSGRQQLDDESRQYLRKHGYAAWQKWLVARGPESAPQVPGPEAERPSVGSSEQVPLIAAVPERSARREQRPPPSPRSAVMACYRSYFDFTGRASRAEFWWFTGWVLGGLLVAAFAGALLGTLTGSYVLSNLPMFGWFLAHAMPFLGAEARRLHDWGRSGWWLLLHVSGIGALILLVMMLPETEPRTNRWGPPATRQSAAR